MSDSVVDSATEFFDSLANEFLNLFLPRGMRPIDRGTATYFSQSQANSSPLILDLNGDGFSTTSIDDGVYFDHDADGIKTAGGWVGAGDGLLALDRDGNGTIDSGRELFGNNTLLSSGETAAEGFAALADLDANADGAIDASDAAWNALRVWVDADADGISDDGELHSLDSLGISEIDLTKTNTTTSQNGNTLIGSGQFTINGETREYTDAWFAQDPFFREFSDSIDVPDELLALPNMGGSGAVRDLREGATQSGRLAGILRSPYGLTADARQAKEVDSTWCVILDVALMRKSGCRLTARAPKHHFYQKRSRVNLRRAHV